MKSLLVVLLAAAVHAETVAGVVVNSATHAPVFGATAEFHTGTGVAGSASTDGDGVFRIDTLPPGKYSVKISRRGFMTQYAGVTVGAAPVHVEIALKPYATLSGRILTPDRQPLAGAKIAILQDGLASISSSVNAAGEFLLEGVEPGEWKLLAVPPNTAPPAAEDGAPRTWVRTYYPDVPDSQAATVIPVRAGAVLSGYDIVVRAVPVRRLRGHVLNPKGDPAAGATVTLIPTGDWNFRDGQPQVHTGPEGAFEFSVPDGRWKLEADLGTPKLFADALVTVTADVDDVAIRLQAPFSLPGKVVADGPPGLRPFVPGVVLIQAGSMGRLFPGKRGEDGAFIVEGLTESEYVVETSIVPPPWYVDSIRLGDREILGEIVEIHSGAIPLTVTLRTDGGAVRGSVENCGGATVLLLPLDVRLLPYAHAGATQCRPDGAFEFAGVRPGDYYAYAFAEPPLQEEYRRLTLAPATNDAVRVTVRRGEATRVDLKVIPRP